jgi:flagellar biosynthesis chaperone FliJ
MIELLKFEDVKNSFLRDNKEELKKGFTKEQLRAVENVLHGLNNFIEQNSLYLQRVQIIQTETPQIEEKAIAETPVKQEVKKEKPQDIVPEPSTVEEDIEDTEEINSIFGDDEE